MLGRVQNKNQTHQPVVVTIIVAFYYNFVFYATENDVVSRRRRCRRL